MHWSTKFSNWLRSVYLVVNERIDPHRQRIRLLSALAGAALALVTSSLLQLAVEEMGWSEEVQHLLRWSLWILAALFFIQVVIILLGILFGKKVRLVTPGRSAIHFYARPYSAIPGKPTPLELGRIGSLSSTVEEEFATDTFRKEIVKHAISTGCGIGLKVTDGAGSDMGFFDVYHLTPEALDGWVYGRTFERDMQPENFVPISEAIARGDKTIDLIVGAIMLTHLNQFYNFYVGPLLAASSRAYLISVLRHFDTVTLYASIYSRAGRRYAELFGFSPYLAAKLRGEASGGFDIYSVTFRPGDPSSKFLSSTRDTTFLLHLEMNPDQLLAE